MTKKKATYNCFKVTMGSYDGAEIYEAVEIYTLSKLENLTYKRRH